MGEVLKFSHTQKERITNNHGANTFGAVDHNWSSGGTRTEYVIGNKLSWVFMHPPWSDIILKYIMIIYFSII
jgi:hypothetical protein